MPTPKPPTLEQVGKAVCTELTAPTPLDEVVSRILERWHSRAKKPEQLIRTHFRYNAISSGIVFLDAKTVAPLSFALQGVRFRIPLDKEQLNRGIVWQDEWFTPFYKNEYVHRAPKQPPTLFDVNAQPIPTRLTTIAIKTDRKPQDDVLFTLFNDDGRMLNAALELRDWLHAHNARPGDSILVTVLDYDRAHFAIEHEPRAKRRDAEIALQNRALAEMIGIVLQETTDERLMTTGGIETAYARLATSRDYPGDHWHQVLAADQRMEETFGMIVPADFESFFDFDPDHPSGIKEQSFPKEQARKVYRWHAQANYSKRVCAIEILGKHTLGDFDAVMHDAFELDPYDHLSEFTRVIRRGKGKYPHETHYGELNPYEKTPARKVRIAGLGLEAGAELEYVYDFGDNLDHQLILESIGELEQGVKYPRFVEVPKHTRRRASE